MSSIQDIEVRSLGELVDLTTPEDRDPWSGRLRDSSVYRGSADPSYPLITSLDRLGGVDPPHTKAHLEEHILRNFVRYSRPYLQPTITNEWELLVTAQHHGLPTRLLDWTYSPLVAAHFATMAPVEGCDRVVWKLDWKRVHESFGLPPIAFLVSDLERMLRSRGVTSLSQLFDAEAEIPDFVCMLEPPALDARIVAQSAAFTVSSDKSRPLNQVLEERGVLKALTRYIIPAARVEHLRDQLDLCRLDERRLFPDLDGVTAEMRRYYSSSGPEAAGGRAPQEVMGQVIGAEGGTRDAGA